METNRHAAMEFLMAKRNYTYNEALAFVHSDWCKCTNEQRRKMLVATLKQPRTMKSFPIELREESLHRPIKLKF